MMTLSATLLCIYLLKNNATNVEIILKYQQETDFLRLNYITDNAMVLLQIMCQ